jgi:hypothetical protein
MVRCPQNFPSYHPTKGQHTHQSKGSHQSKESLLYLQGSIKYNQFGACGNQVIAVMRLHERGIPTIVGFRDLLRMLIFQIRETI